jgi:hypothetical protein
MSLVKSQIGQLAKGLLSLKSFDRNVGMVGGVFGLGSSVFGLAFLVKTMRDIKKTEKARNELNITVPQISQEIQTLIDNYNELPSVREKVNLIKSNKGPLAEQVRQFQDKIKEIHPLFLPIIEVATRLLFLLDTQIKDANTEDVDDFVINLLPQWQEVIQGALFLTDESYNKLKNRMKKILIFSTISATILSGVILRALWRSR